MEKFNTLEEMEEIFIDRGFAIDCFDAYSRHMTSLIYAWINVILFIGFVLALTSFVYIDFTWKRLALMFGFYIFARFLTSLTLSRVMALTEKFTINAKRNIGNNVLQQYYSYYDKMSDADKEEIFARFIASRIGLITTYK